MATIKFERITSPIGSVQFSDNPCYGSSMPFEFKQPKDYSDGGELYIYNKGLVEDIFILVFKKMTEADYSNMTGFFKNVIQGAGYSFTYYDENGTAHTVRLMDDAIDFKIEGHGDINESGSWVPLYRAGSITLRKE